MPNGNEFFPVLSMLCFVFESFFAALAITPGGIAQVSGSAILTPRSRSEATIFEFARLTSPAINLHESKETNLSGVADYLADTRSSVEVIASFANPGGTIGNAKKLRNLNSSDNARSETIAATAYGMKCDGWSDDSSALQTALNAAVTIGANIVLLPPGTCIIQQKASFFPYDGEWIRGAGIDKTTIKRANRVNSIAAIFNPGAGGVYGSAGSVTFSDFTIDGNKMNQLSDGDAISGGAWKGLHVFRMRIQNSYGSAISSFPSGRHTTSDVLIADSEFVSNCHDATQNYDIRVRQPLRLRVLRNKFINSACLGTLGLSANDGVGQVEIAENIDTGFTGFGVALGGGSNGGSNTAAEGADIHDNVFSSESTTQNVIDLASWTDTNVHHNLFLKCGVGFACIADLPPGFKENIEGNRMYPDSTNAASIGIGVGGSDVRVVNNFVQGAGGSGIAYGVAKTGPSKHVVIANNVSKNNNRANPSLYTKAGIELFLEAGGKAALTDVIITYNHAYDDQTPKTQSYGIEIANSDQSIGLSNITVEGNNLCGNRQSALLNRATSFSNFSISNNEGYSSIGLCNSAPVSPPSK